MRSVLKRGAVLLMALTLLINLAAEFVARYFRRKKEL